MPYYDEFARKLDTLKSSITCPTTSKFMWHSVVCSIVVLICNPTTVFVSPERFCKMIGYIFLALLESVLLMIACITLVLSR